MIILNKLGFRSPYQHLMSGYVCIQLSEEREPVLMDLCEEEVIEKDNLL